MEQAPSASVTWLPQLSVWIRPGLGILLSSDPHFKIKPVLLEMGHSLRTGQTPTNRKRNSKDYEQQLVRKCNHGDFVLWVWFSSASWWFLDRCTLVILQQIFGLLSTTYPVSVVYSHLNSEKTVLTFQLVFLRLHSVWFFKAVTTSVNFQPLQLWNLLFVTLILFEFFNFISMFFFFHKNKSF